MEMLSALHDSEAYKTIPCLCGGQLVTITDDFTIESGDSIGADEIVRCERCGDEFDADDNEMLASRKAAA